MSSENSKNTKAIKLGRLPKIIILAGFVILVLVVIIVKNPQKKIDADPGIVTETAEMQLDRYLEEGKPTFLFFHSNNCQTCIDMMAVVDEVYPAFSKQVALVDVNVYDPANQNLLQRARISSIPTQVFIDSTEKGNGILGPLSAGELTEQLQLLAEEDQ